MSAGRRRTNASEARAIVHKVRVNDSEEAVLITRASEQGVTVARLLVESALADGGGETRAERENILRLYFRIERLLANVANNVNQIAKVANTTGAIDIGELRAHLRGARQVYDDLEELISRSAL